MTATLPTEAATEFETLDTARLRWVCGANGAKPAPKPASALGHDIKDPSGHVIIPNFGHPNNNNFRGGRPTHAGIDYLHHIGVNTVLDLESHPHRIAHERAWAEKDGMNFQSVPMSSHHEPSSATLSHAAAVLDNPANWPVFTHCHHGQDRTGLVEALDRVHNGWTPRAANDEMVNYGSKSAPDLLRSFSAQTGFTPPR